MENNLESDKGKRPRNSPSLIVHGTNGQHSKKGRAVLPLKPQIPSEKEEKHILYGVSAPPRERHFVDIDSDHANPQSYSIYARDIYERFRAFERVRRPHSNYMKTTQSDINERMRAKLIDWMVEVNMGYEFVPDTLYLSVYLTDWFLSQNHIRRERLQLLGLTCIIIASKYEETCIPFVDSFCGITDNSCTGEEVLKLERQVLKSCGFRVSAPTLITFLRRFIRAAQALYQSPSIRLEHLANYLTELTLTDYSFLKFLPSLIAASAVFLARWTLDQTNHPWALNLEYFTSYKSSDLKCTVLALRDLQLNTKGCPLTTIRRKYSEREVFCVKMLIYSSARYFIFPGYSNLSLRLLIWQFDLVATLTSPRLLDRLF